MMAPVATLSRHLQQPSRPHLAASAAHAPATLQQTSAVALGYMVLAGSCFRSMPQIARIVRIKSAEGVSLTAIWGELAAYSITVAYNLQHGFGFSNYGETVACWLQDVVLIVIINSLRGLWGVGSLAGAAAFAAATWWLMSGRCGMRTLFLLQASTIAIISLGARIPQIMLNHRRGDSGELSMLSCMLNLAGNIARIATTLVLTQDTLILVGTAIQAVLNSILVAQTYSTARRQSQHAAGAAA